MMMNNLTFILSFTLILVTTALNSQSFTEVKKLTASNAMQNDLFGEVVDVSGDLAVVSTNAVNNDEEDVFIYSRNFGGSSQWGEVAILKSSETTFSRQNYGSAVAIDGETVIVGADRAFNVGRAFIYMKDAGGIDNWGEVAQLAPLDGQTNDQFGQSVSISGDVVIVGSWQDDDGGSRSGSAYIFSKDAGGPNQWGQVAKLIASDAAAQDQFGEHVDISGDVAIVGAHRSDRTGSAYIFSKDKGGLNQWGEVTKLVSSDMAPNDDFADDVAISGDIAMVGAPGDDTAFSSIGGSVYVFSKDAGGLDQWGETARLTTANSLNLGTSVDIDEYIAVSGATQSRINGDIFTGNAYIFKNVPPGSNQWIQSQEIYASDATTLDLFGIDVAVSGDVVIVGAHLDDDVASASGSAYVFERAVCHSSFSILANNSLSGNQLDDAIYLADGIIQSTQFISNGAEVDYDSGTSIELLQTFEVNTGSIFHAFINGCTP